MNLVAKIIKLRIPVIIFFVLATLICAFLQSGVQINYDLADYLPHNAPSTVALEIMEEEFTHSIPNARVYLPKVTLVEALNFKQKLAALPGVKQVLWLTMLLIFMSLALADTKTGSLVPKRRCFIFTDDC